MGTRLLATYAFSYYADDNEIRSCVVNLTHIEAVLAEMNEFRQAMPQNDEIEWLLGKEIRMFLFDYLIEPLDEIFPVGTCRLVNSNEIEWNRQLQEYRTILYMNRHTAYIEIRDYETAEVVAEIDLSIGKIKDYIGDWRKITRDRDKQFWEARDNWKKECIESFLERHPDPEWEGRIGITDIGEVEIGGTFLLFPPRTVKTWEEYCKEHNLDFGG